MVFIYRLFIAATNYSYNQHTSNGKYPVGPYYIQPRFSGSTLSGHFLKSNKIFFQQQTSH